MIITNSKETIARQKPAEQLSLSLRNTYWSGCHHLSEFILANDRLRNLRQKIDKKSENAIRGAELRALPRTPSIATVMSAKFVYYTRLKTRTIHHNLHSQSIAIATKNCKNEHKKNFKSWNRKVRHIPTWWEVTTTSASNLVIKS